MIALMRLLSVLRWRVLGYCFLGLGSPFSSTQSAGTTNLLWHWSNPLPFGNNIADLIGDTNRYYLAVADHGQSYLSEDLAHWTHLDTGTRRFLRAATFHALGTDTNAVIIAGESGLILRLHGSREISATSLPTTDWLEGIASSGTRVVAVGDNAAVYTSDDGTNWLRRNTGVATWLRGVAYHARKSGGGTFAAVGETGQILTSPDGVAWTRRSSGTSSDLNRVAATPNGYIAIGAGGTVLISSNEGQRWTTSAIGATDELFAVTTETRAVLNQSITVPLVVGDHIVRSAVSLGNGLLWTDELDTRRTAPAPVSSYYAAIHDGTRYVIGGQAGLIVTGARGTGLDQSLLWTPYDSPPRAILWDVATATALGTNVSAALVDGAIVTTTNRNTNTLYSAVGYGPTFLQSDNGIEWTTALAPAAASNAVFLGASGRLGRLVSVGSGGRIAYSPQAYVPLVSTNVFTNGATVLSLILTNHLNTLGLAWFDAPSGVTNDLKGVASSDSLWVATGANGTVLTSANALNWTRRTTPTTRFLSGVESGVFGWVAVGEMGTILTSPDGITWTARSSGTTNWLWRVRYLNGNFLAAGQNGTLLGSSNGTDWSPRTSGVTNWLYGLEMVDGTYYAAGAQGVILTSVDAVEWNLADTITGKPLYGLATANGQLIAAGSEGAILRAQAGPFPSPPSLSKWPTSAADQLFLVKGHMDQRLRLERSEDLESWVPGEEIEITAPDGSVLLYDTTPNASGTQLFRAAERR